jgi:uncharacterized protein (TIGR03435 family)
MTRAICACFATLTIAIGQQVTDTPSFEVASIKPADPDPASRFWVGMTADAGMVRFPNITLRDCIRAAYRVRDFQVQGPEWMDQARFEINAKLPAGVPLDRIPEMLQALLTERFQLSLRRDTKELPVYALLPGNAGPKLKSADVKPDDQSPMALGPDGKPRAPMMFRYTPSGIVLTAPSASLPTFVELMSRFTVRPVIDVTGLQGRYQFELAFAPETTPGGVSGLNNAPAFPDPGPSLFDAVKQYGLRLQARKAPIEILTVTHLERTPTEN